MWAECPETVVERPLVPSGRPLGRWHKLGGNQGFVLAESIDAVAIGKWIQEWTDLLLFDVAPVVDDEDVMKVLGA